MEVKWELRQSGEMTTKSEHTEHILRNVLTKTQRNTAVKRTHTFTLSRKVRQCVSQSIGYSGNQSPFTQIYLHYWDV